MNIMHKQIKNLFTNTIDTLITGLWFSGYKFYGEYRAYFENGKVYEKCFFNEHENIDGEYKQWYKDGELYSHKLYKDGKTIKDYLIYGNS